MNLVPFPTASAMKFISLRVRPDRTYHGYSADNTAITEEVVGSTFVEKVIAVDRILSITEDYVFITTTHGRVQIWSYEGSLSAVKDRLATAGLLVA